MEGAHGIIRINPMKADMDEEGGLFHRMHLGVHITVHGEAPWLSGLSEDSGHKCHWEAKHCDIDSKHSGKIMTISVMDHDKEHGQMVEVLVGEVEMGVGTWLVPGEKEIELFRKDKHGHAKKAGHLILTSEFIPIPTHH